MEIAAYCTFLILLFALLMGCHDPKLVIVLERTEPYPYMEIEEPDITFYRNVPTDILDRLIQSESSWVVDAKSKKEGENSIGLAQVNMEWFEYFQKKYGITDPLKPSEALDFAADYLHDLYLATGSWYEACLGYKCGLDGRADAPEWKKELCHWIAEGGER